MITDPDEAVRAPGVAALSVIAHGHSARALEVGRAGIAAAESLDDPDATLYADMVVHHLDAAARRALELEMGLKLKNKYEYQSPTFRRLVAEGEVKGEAKGRLRSIEVLLEARGFQLDGEVRQRLKASGADELDALVVRAASIETLDELFED